jgi:hypothetical protein
VTPRPTHIETSDALADLAKVEGEGNYDDLLRDYGGSDPDGFLEWVARLSTPGGIREMVVLTKVDLCLATEEGLSLVALNSYVAQPCDDHGLAVVRFRDEVRGGGMADQHEPDLESDRLMRRSGTDAGA